MRTFEQQLQQAVGASYPLDVILANISADKILEEVNIFAKEVAKEALKNASDNATTTQFHKNDGIFDIYKTVVDKQSILNESNIPNF